jgi:antitoxin (DNA-binding transcriptional repressor) of toxin-antitoxin stability system
MDRGTNSGRRREAVVLHLGVPGSAPEAVGWTDDERESSKQLAVEQEMVITDNGRPIALLTPLSDETLEQSLSAMRRARARLTDMVGDSCSSSLVTRQRRLP